MSGLPEAFVQRMAAQLGDGLPAFLRAYNEPGVGGLRLNPLKPVPVEALPEGVLDPVPWAAEGRYLAVDSLAGSSVLHEAGAFYLQEPSAMLPAAVLDPRPGENVLDLCAAPGGKTTQLGCRMLGEGLLVSNEPVPARAAVLSRNVERMGIGNALVVSALPDQLAARWPEGFDAVLVDAPCSGEGMFRRHPETRDEWTESAAAGCAKRQAEILDAAAALVRPGGRLVYATCTFNPAENGEAVAAFCRRQPAFAPAAFSLPGAEGPEGMLTCYPQRMRGEGQFVALLHKSGTGAAALPRGRQPVPDKAALAALQAFAPFAGPAALLGDTLFSLPGCPALDGLKVLRAGIRLGQMRGKLFVPDHAWAVSACPPELPRLPLSARSARLYQAGEALPTAAQSGYVLPTFAGLPLGLAKVSDGLLKNHYPKGLRRPA